MPKHCREVQEGSREGSQSPSNVLASYCQARRPAYLALVFRLRQRRPPPPVFLHLEAAGTFSHSQGGRHLLPPPPTCLHELGRSLRIPKDVSGVGERWQAPQYQRVTIRSRAPSAV